MNITLMNISIHDSSDQIWENKSTISIVIILILSLDNCFIK